ncbi:MAG: FkbM family methyltransferase [Chroococcidiopsidaceae cyanobacterium CP_BM_ER_R8_30]|nr:FkbM family methyltransferase [Chroococcidiopsidaceae cyanobacterium CP_BM_ER_R8_30]
MQNSIAETLLPNGKKVFCVNKDEIPALYEEIKDYFKSGIEIFEESTVFDVGANIGLFALRIFELSNNNVDVYAFEPIPNIFEALQKNAQCFAPSRLKVFPYGLSKESSSQNFIYYPNVTVWSTTYPDNSKREREKVKRIVLTDIKKYLPSFPWLNWLPPFMRSFALDKILKIAFQQFEQVTCQLKTISEVIREHGIQQIDLLKIDVERAELDVLLGIEASDWSKIKQIVVEVHDLERRVNKIELLLKENGFTRIDKDQAKSFEGTDIYYLYASR